MSFSSMPILESVSLTLPICLETEASIMAFAISRMLFFCRLASPDLMPPFLPLSFASSLVLTGIKSFLATVCSPPFLCTKKGQKQTCFKSISALFYFLAIKLRQFHSPYNLVTTSSPAIIALGISIPICLKKSG